MDDNTYTYSREEITKNFDLVNQFNNNFYCSNVNTILGLFKKVNDIWQHPLLLNNHYCLLCKEISSSPFSLYHLQSTHLMNSPYDFLQSKGIKLRHLPKAQRRLKRRFIHSLDNHRQLTIERLFNNKLEDTFSDSDLMFIQKKKEPVESIELNKIRKKTFSRFTIQENVDAFQRTEKQQRRYTCSEKTAFKETNQNEEDVEAEKKDILILCPDQKKKVSHRLSIMKIFKKMISYDGRKKKEKKDEQKIDSTMSSQKNIVSEMAKEVSNKKEEALNDNCELCLEKMNDKYVLGCGDFYCRECIRGILLNGLKDISHINKLCCPKEICKEPIERRVIEKLLSTEEFARYEKLQIRVQGLMDRSLIPCPYPNCEHYGKESEIKRNLLLCGEEHLFCVKCLSIISPTEAPDNDHTCEKKDDDAIKYLSTHKFIKKCPNCFSWVGREPGGCNNMTCLNPWCNYEFCWICEGMYDNTHYKNPFSICFGLGESDHKSKFSRYKSIRVLKCVFLFLLLIFIILPIVMLLFSFVVVGLYFVSFVLDGSAMKNIKLKNKGLNTFFNILVYMFYFFLSIASIPLGYLAIGFLILSPPVLCVVKKCKKLKKKELN